MKRKLLILAPILATSTVALAASCTNKNDQTDKELAELKLRISRLNSDYATEKSELQKQLEALKAKLSVEISDKDQKDSTIADLQRQLEELQKQVEAAEGKKVKKNNLSARTLYGELVKFLAEDFPKAMQDQNPEAFNSNKDLFNKISESVKLSAEEFKTTPEDFKHLFTWQNAIFYNLNRAQLVAKFIDDPSNPVTVLTPKSQLMDELFNWRIKDLDRIIQELSYDSYKEANKTELIAQVKDAKAKYQKAKDESSLFAHQIAKWFELERESSDETKGPIRDIVNFASPQFRELLPKFKLPAFKISLFPVYRQIVDEEFKAEVKKELLELNRLFSEWLKTNGQGYVRSIRFNDLYNKAKEVTNTIVTALKDNNLDYFNEFNTWNDLKSFVSEAKLVIFDTEFIDYKSEKNKIDNIVDRELNVRLPKSFAHEFNKKYSNKRDYDNDKNNSVFNYLWKDFYSKYNTLINNVFKLPKSNFTESYARYAQYLTLLKQVKFSEELINLHNNLGDDLDNPELIQLLKWDNSAKFDKQIETKKIQIQNAQSFINGITNGLIFDNVEANPASVNALFEKVTQFKTTLSKQLQEDGDWIQYFFGFENIQENLVQKFNEYYSKINEYSKMENISEEIAKEINSLTKQMWTEIVGTKENSVEVPKTLIGRFNKSLSEADISHSGEEYKNYISIFSTILTVLNKVSKENKESVLKEVEQNIKVVEEIFYYGNPWFGIALDDSVRYGFQKELKDILLKTKSLIEKSNDKNSLDGEVKKLVAEIGELNDGVKKSALLTEIFDDIHGWGDDIKHIERRKKQATETAKYIPGQEIFVLLRYWKNNLQSKTSSNLPDKNSNPDKLLANFFNNLFSKLANNGKYKSITSIAGDREFFETESDDPALSLKIYNEFKDLETKYAEDLLKFINSDSQDKLSAKKSLVESREKYYNYINSFKEKKIIPDTWVRFSGDKYINSEYPDERFVSSTLLGFAADAYALSDMIDNFANKKFYEE